jgi:hypothetical protein
VRCSSADARLNEVPRRSGHVDALDGHGYAPPPGPPLSGFGGGTVMTVPGKPSAASGGASVSALISAANDPSSHPWLLKWMASAWRSWAGSRTPFRGVGEALDRAASLAPGHGRVDLLGFVEPGRLGGRVDYAHRLTPALSAFAQGWAGAERDAMDRWHTGYGAMGGLRLVW